MNGSNIFIIVRLFMKSESKITAFLDTHLLFSWDAGTKHLIGCKWVMKTVGNSGLNQMNLKATGIKPRLNTGSHL